MAADRIPRAIMSCSPGQRVILELPGGGGFGSPIERDPARVLADVRAGYVSVAAAESEYGVVIYAATMKIDQAATAALRKEREA